MSLFFSAWFIMMLMGAALYAAVTLQSKFLRTMKPGSVRVTDAATGSAFAVVYTGSVVYLTVGLILGAISGFGCLLTALGLYLTWFVLHVTAARSNKDEDDTLKEDFEKALLEDLVSGGPTLTTMPDAELNALHMNLHQELKRRSGPSAS